MKLLAQFYACLAIIVFIAVIGGIEARSSSISFMTSGNRDALHKEDPQEKHISDIEHKMVRRSASVKDELKQVNQKPQESPRHRRGVPMENPIPKQPPVPIESVMNNGRERRQISKIPGPEDMPGTVPNPESMAKYIPRSK